MSEYSLNKIDGFNPFDHVENSHNRRGEDILKKDGKPLKYLGTAAKVLWFRKVCPRGAIIVSEVNTPAQDFGTIVKYKAEIWLDISDPKPVAEWQHQETVWDVAEMDNIVSKVQTIVVGKALSKAGFGCEIEFELGAVSEGETVVETTPSEPPAETPEAPKKKRGRPKKTAEETEAVEEEAKDFLKEAEDLLKNTEVPKKAEAEPEPEVESASETDKLEEAKAVKLVCTDAATVNIRKYEGMSIKDILDQYPTFCKLVKTRPNVRKGISDECAEAAIYIFDNTPEMQ